MTPSRRLELIHKRKTMRNGSRPANRIETALRELTAMELADELAKHETERRRDERLISIVSFAFAFVAGGLAAAIGLGAL